MRAVRSLITFGPGYGDRGIITTVKSFFMSGQEETEIWNFEPYQELRSDQIDQKIDGFSSILIKFQNEQNI